MANLAETFETIIWRRLVNIRRAASIFGSHLQVFCRLCKITVYQDKKSVLCEMAGAEIRVTKHLSRVKLYRELGALPCDKAMPFIGHV